MTSLWPIDEPPTAVAFRRARREVGSAVALRPHEGWRGDPIGWIVEKLGVPEHTLRWSLDERYAGHRWDGTEDPLVAIADALASWQDVGIESATGTGKSFLAACLTLWFLACHENARVYSYAPKEDQLRLYMWAEITHLWPRFARLFPSAKLTDLRIRMDGNSDKWSAHGYAVQIRAGQDSATGAQGAHAEHMLLITEETPGIDPSVMTAIENTATAPHNLRLALGNPDNQHDPLHRFCLQHDVVHVRISALDHPNVVCDDASIVPGAVSTAKVEKRRAEYGEDNPLYLSRVRGVSPSESQHALIKWAWLEEAAARYSDPSFRAGLPALGVDVANSEAGDEAAIARGLGACLLEVESFPCPDSNELGVRVGAEMEAGDPEIEPRHVGVDSVGVGAGTVNKLKELRKRVKALNGGARSFQRIKEDLRYLELEEGEEPPPTVVEAEVYKNLRAQMWWTMRDDLQHGRVALPYDEDLFRDLTTPMWETRDGKIIIEPKEKIRERLGRSPDKGDAVVYWNWVRRRAPLPVTVVKPDTPDYDHEGDAMLDDLAKRHAKRKKQAERLLKRAMKRRVA